MTADQHRFETHYDLSLLPYFELRDGNRLVLADPSIGPIIDVHTHLALAYVRRNLVDLERETPVVEHYLPAKQPLDLEIYANKNFTKQDLKAMKRDLILGSLSSGGMRATHTAPNLIAEMKDLQIRTSVILAIDMAARSWNAENYLEVAERHPELICYGSVHPRARNVADKLERQKMAGARGIKVHPAVQTIAADNPKAMALYRYCADLDLPILFHCGPVDIEPPLGRHLSQLKHYWRAVAENPDTTFVLGHSGALQWKLALDLAKNYPNVHLEIASQSTSVIRTLIEEGPEDRIMMGSDWPFYHQATAVAKALLATEGNPSARKRLLWENAARFLDIQI